eukprot:PITA_22714
MGRSPCCSKEGLNRGAWTSKEDTILSEYIRIHGDGGWRNLPKKAGLMRCGKSCRLRWLNYLRPDIKRGNISPDEEDLIIRLHRLLGNRWSLIAGRLPGRTDNEIKNYWNTRLTKKMLSVTQSQHESTKNLKTVSKSPPMKSPVLKTIPVRIKMAVRQPEIETPKGYNGYGCNWHQDYNLLSHAPDYGSEELCREPATNIFEVVCFDQSNVQRVNSFTNADDQGMETWFHNTQEVDWIHELDLEKGSPPLLGLLLSESDEEWKG